MLRLNQFPQLGKFKEIKKHISKWTSRVYRVMLLWPVRTRDIISVQLQSQSCEKAGQSNRSVQPCSYECTTIKVCNHVPTSATFASRAICWEIIKRKFLQEFPQGPDEMPRKGVWHDEWGQIRVFCRAYHRQRSSHVPTGTQGEEENLSALHQRTEFCWKKIWIKSIWR